MFEFAIVAIVLIGTYGFIKLSCDEWEEARGLSVPHRDVGKPGCVRRRQ